MMKILKNSALGGFGALSLVLSCLAVSADDYSPGIGRDYPNQLLWGDTHLHTNMSPDAYSFGNTKLSPDDAFRYAKGETVISNNGTPAKLERPLDFIVVSDHAAFMGYLNGINSDDEFILSTKIGKRWKKFIDAGENVKVLNEFVAGVNGDRSIQPELSSVLKVWQGVVDVAEQHNTPGSFTALHGYEWTSIMDGNNLHRVVMFKDDADKVRQFTPFSSLQSNYPEDLWDALEVYRQELGGTVMSIPHNGNLSNGTMFDLNTKDGPMSASYAEQRIRNELLYEVTQVKGDSETNPGVSPDDQFADYYSWDEGNIAMSEKKETSMLAGEYARPALIRGLGLQQKLGVNPFKFGVIGSTDNHTSLAGNEENNFFGKFQDSEPSHARSVNTMGAGVAAAELWPNASLAASGLAAVWADANTRDGIYSAMQRKEVYATTGPRIYLRYFAGWDFQAADLNVPNPVALGYQKGVPMGNDLVGQKDAKQAPSLMIMAAKDAEGANLARVQVIKGWWTKGGKAKEKVYDVDIAYDQLAPHTVSVENATYTNTVGMPQSSTVWQDPDFDSNVATFYYVRVIEIPTPTWLAYDAVHFDYAPKKDALLIHQERAYGSPIWYTPAEL